MVMKKISEIRLENLNELLQHHSMAEISRLIGHSSQSTLSQIVNRSPDSRTGKPKNLGDSLSAKIEKSLGLPSAWMDTDHGFKLLNQMTELGNSPILKDQPNAKVSDFELIEADGDIQLEAYEIVYLDARGSCGGGSLEPGEQKGKLIKEASFFIKYKLKPKDAVVVYADGDSMSDYICDGDMVIFDKSKKEPKSGKIFLITHPDGLRIKQLRREIDGTWVLESRNPDKRSFPDERIAPAVAELLKIEGEFVYRQGG